MKLDETTLGLDLDWESTADGRERIARVALQEAAGFTRDGGAPTLTENCKTAASFKLEVARLIGELEQLAKLGEAELEGRGEEGPAKPVESASVALPSKTEALETDLTVGDVMTRDVKTLNRNDRIAMADELMKVGRFRHVVVLDEDERVAGVVSQRDIFYSALAWTLGEGRNAHQRALEASPVKDVMQTDVAAVDSKVPLADAARTLMERKIGCLPVIDGGKLVGILTEGDFLALLAVKGTGRGSGE